MLGSARPAWGVVAFLEGWRTLIATSCFAFVLVKAHLACVEAFLFPFAVVLLRLALALVLVFVHVGLVVGRLLR